MVTIVHFLLQIFINLLKIAEVFLSVIQICLEEIKAWLFSSLPLPPINFITQPPPPLDPFPVIPHKLTQSPPDILSPWWCLTIFM